VDIVQYYSSGESKVICLEFTAVVVDNLVREKSPVPSLFLKCCLGSAFMIYKFAAILLSQTFSNNSKFISTGEVITITINLRLWTTCTPMQILKMTMTTKRYRRDVLSD